MENNFSLLSLFTGDWMTVFVSLVLDFAAISMNNVVVNIPFALAAAQQIIDKREKRSLILRCRIKISTSRKT